MNSFFFTFFSFCDSVCSLGRRSSVADSIDEGNELSCGGEVMEVMGVFSCPLVRFDL